MYILCDVFLFVITLPDCFSICIFWITLYVFEKDILLPMVVCHAHARVKSLEYTQNATATIALRVYSTYPTAENVFAFRFL